MKGVSVSKDIKDIMFVAKNIREAKLLVQLYTHQFEWKLFLTLTTFVDFLMKTTNKTTFSALQS